MAHIIIYDFVISIIKSINQESNLDTRPDAYVDVHSYAQYWMYPYGYKLADCESSTKDFYQTI